MKLNLIKNLALSVKKGAQEIGLHIPNLSRKSKVFAGILGAGVTISAIIIATAPASAPQVYEEKIWPVAVHNVVPDTLSAALTLYGKVETQRSAKLTAAITAEVQQVHVREGDSVLENQVLISLDDADSRLEVQQRTADVLEAKALVLQTEAQHKVDLKVFENQAEVQKIVQAKFARYEKLHHDRMVSDTQYDEIRMAANQASIDFAQQQIKVANYAHQKSSVKARLARAQSLLAQAELQLSRTEIRAPFAGKITSLPVSPGNRLSLGTVVVAMFDDSSLEIRTAIPAETVARLRPLLERGQKLSAIANVNGREMALELATLAAAVDAGHTGVNALFQFSDKGALPELGRVINLTLTLPAMEHVLAVPAQAVYDNKRIYQIQDHRLHAVEVAIMGERQGPNGEFQLLVQADPNLDNLTILASQLPNAITGMKVSIAGEPDAVASDSVGQLSDTTPAEASQAAL